MRAGWHFKEDSSIHFNIPVLKGILPLFPDCRVKLSIFFWSGGMISPTRST